MHYSEKNHSFVDIDINASGGLSRHPDRIDRTRMGIHRCLKLYPHVQKRLRHVAT